MLFSIETFSWDGLIATKDPLIQKYHPPMTWGVYGSKSLLVQQGNRFVERPPCIMDVNVEPGSDRSRNIGPMEATSFLVSMMLGTQKIATSIFVPYQPAQSFHRFFQPRRPNGCSKDLRRTQGLHGLCEGTREVLPCKAWKFHMVSTYTTNKWTLQTIHCT